MEEKLDIFRVFVCVTDGNFYQYVPRIIHLISEKVKTHNVKVHTGNSILNNLLEEAGCPMEMFNDIHEAVIVLGKNLSRENLEFFRNKNAKIRILK